MRFFVCLLALLLGALPGRAESVTAIGGADGPTKIYLAPGGGLFSLIENQMPWMTFSDMNDELLADTERRLGDIAAAYAFYGRMGGECGYVVGVLSQPDSPLKGLSMAQVDEDHFEFYADGEETPRFTVEGALIFCDPSAPELVIVVPARGRAFDAYAAYERVISRDFAYLEDAAARGVSVVEPPAPYLRVYHYVEGEARCEYIALSDEDVRRALLSSRLYTPEELGRDALAFVSEDGEATHTDVPAPLYELATRLCGFAVASPEDIGELASARMSLANGETVINGETMVNDAEALAELRELLAGARRVELGGCPYTGILTLTMTDGRTLTVQKATDSCGTMIFGGMRCYELGTEENERLWQIFSEN